MNRIFKFISCIAICCTLVISISGCAMTVYSEVDGLRFSATLSHLGTKFSGYNIHIYNTSETNRKIFPSDFSIKSDVERYVGYDIQNTLFTESFEFIEVPARGDVSVLVLFGGSIDKGLRAYLLYFSKAVVDIARPYP